MPGMKIKVPSNSVHVKQHAGAGSAPPKQYVKEVQQRICSNANAAWNRRRGRSYVSISTNYTRACHATNTKRSASKTTEGNASETKKKYR